MGQNILTVLFFKKKIKSQFDMSWFFTILNIDLIGNRIYKPSWPNFCMPAYKN